MILSLRRHGCENTESEFLLWCLVDQLVEHGRRKIFDLILSFPSSEYGSRSIRICLTIRVVYCPDPPVTGKCKFHAFWFPRWATSRTDACERTFSRWPPAEMSECCEGVVGWQQRRVESWHPLTRNRYAYRSYLSLDTNDWSWHSHIHQNISERSFYENWIELQYNRLK